MLKIGSYYVTFEDLPDKFQYTEQQLCKAFENKYKDFNDMLMKNWENHHSCHHEGGKNKCGRGELTGILKYLEQRRTDGKYIFKLVGFKEDDGGRKSPHTCWFSCGKLNLTAKDIDI